jgi:prepilin-type processing-associated H-X9-DG protein
MPFLDHSDIYDQWDFKDSSGTAIFGSYYNTATSKLISGGNLKLAETSIKVLTCPADTSLQVGRGNLSYVVNGGFNWHWRVDLASTGAVTAPYDYTNKTTRRASGNFKNMGMFFLSASPAYVNSFSPALGVVDAYSLTTEQCKDGATTTVMLTENLNVGVNANWETPTYPSNWACPHPWNTSFFANGWAVGANATNVAGYTFQNSNNRGRRAPPADTTFTPSEGGLNGDLSGANEGLFPYPTSNHTGGVNVAMADGSVRFLNDTIDSRVWARLVTPNGARLVKPDTGVQNGVAQEDDAGVGFTQNPLKETDF